MTTTKKKTLEKSRNHLFVSVCVFFLLLLMLLFCHVLFVGSCRSARIPLVLYRFFIHRMISQHPIEMKKVTKIHRIQFNERKSWEYSINTRLWVSLYNNSFLFFDCCFECARMHFKKFESRRFTLKTIARTRE